MSDEKPQAMPSDPSSPNDNCSVGGHCRRSGLMRAVMYTPVVVILSGLAALATFPELARYASPLVGESTGGNYTCPIAALASRMGCGSCPSKSSTVTVDALLASRSATTSTPAGCCANSAIARFNCCAGTDACPSSAAETTDSVDAPTADVAPSADEAPADAFATANGPDSDTPSN